MSRMRLIEIVGIAGSLASVLVAIDYYIFRSGIAVTPVPLWILALVIGLISLAALVLVYRLRSEAVIRPRPLLPSDAGTVLSFVQSRHLLETAGSIDVWLYTSETVSSPWRAQLETNPGPLLIRLLIRRPETDPQKRDPAEGSLATLREIARVNRKINIDVHFYNESPLLRLEVFKSARAITCLAGVYRYDHTHPMRFIGAEDNRMFFLDNSKHDERLLINALTSRFEELWLRTSSLRAVLFDLDGVLVDSMEHHHRTWRDAFAAAGVSPDADSFRHDVYRLEGHEAVATVKKLYLKYTGSVPDDATINVIVSQKNKAYLQRIGAMNTFDGMADILADLRMRQVPTALVSGSTAPVVQEIVARLFPRMFDVVITDSDSPVGKPDAAPYHAALKRLDMHDTASCVAIENAPLGVRSAVAAGLRVFGILRNSPLQPSDLHEAGATKVFAGWEELFQTLKGTVYIGS